MGIVAGVTGQLMHTQGTAGSLHKGISGKLQRLEGPEQAHRAQSPKWCFAPQPWVKPDRDVKHRSHE